MTFGYGYSAAPAKEGQVANLTHELAKSDERLRAMDKQLQRVAGMVEKLYELRYHRPPPPVKRSVRLDEEDEQC